MTRCSPSTEQSAEQSAEHLQVFNPSTTTVDADEIAAAAPLMEMPVTSAIYSPRAGAVLECDDTASVGGFAWSGGGRGIIRVDVSADGGSTWHKTELTAGADQPSGRAWAWTFWEAEVRYLGGTSRRYLSAIYLGESRSPRRRAQSRPLIPAQVPLPKPREGEARTEAVLVCKAVDAAHNTQPERPESVWNLRGLANNAWHRVPVYVAQAADEDE